MPLLSTAPPTLKFKLASPIAPLRVVIPLSEITKLAVPFILLAKVIFAPVKVLSVLILTAPLKF